MPALPAVRFLIAAASAVLAFVSAGTAAQGDRARAPSLEPEAVAEALAARGEVRTRQGRTFRGEILRADSEALVLRAEADGGEAEITFPRGDVRSLRLGGGDYLPLALDLVDGGDYEEGLRLLRAIHRQRGPLLDYLSEGDRHYFVEAAPRFRKAGDPLTAAALARQLDPLVTDPGARRTLARERMLGYLDLRFFDEARAEARALADDQPLFPDSATAQYTLARIELEADNPEAALAHALRAVVYAADGAEQLRDCYKLATRLARELEDSATAERLAAEMQHRRFDAPVDESGDL
ncbi:MAG: hypothetical protein JJU00_18460 [Opitutales bacterium]|nr:hypothetical protein [Opitutales bacterium]